MTVKKDLLTEINWRIGQILCLGKRIEINFDRPYHDKEQGFILQGKLEVLMELRISRKVRIK
jgi:hypothetical protein